jgi:hypothetical protein
VYDWRNDYATHQPVLYAAALATSGPIAEFGCGHGSTVLLHELAADHGRPLVTLESDPSWLDRFRQRLESPTHEFRLVDDWDAELARSEWDDGWSLVFVDQQPWEARAATVRRVAETAELVVLHDADYVARAGLVGTELEPLAGPRRRGRRDYGDVFASWREFFPPEPWPYARTGPPTLLGSNVRDVHELDVDYRRHVPRSWHVLRHVRRAAPVAARVRRRAARLTRQKERT